MLLGFIIQLMYLMTCIHTYITLTVPTMSGRLREQIGHKLRCQKVTFRSNILGTTFSLWFYVARVPTNSMLKVLHDIPCSFLSGCV